MASKHMKRFLVSLVIRAMEMKSTVRYHFILTKIVIIKMTENKN